MPAEYFVDTSGWFELTVARAGGNDRVRSAMRERVAAGARAVTTNLVVAETHALLLRRTAREGALRFLRDVTRSPNAIVASDPDIEAAATREWIERYDDQDFSLTDAVSFTVMAQRNIREALTLDHHFAVAGFVMVPGDR